MKELALSQHWYQFVLMGVVCYIIGCFNFAKLIARFKHKDITKIGSGNPGTMNMSREFGLKVGIITFFCDAFKGGFPRSSAILYIAATYSRAAMSSSRISPVIFAACASLSGIFTPSR